MELYDAYLKAREEAKKVYGVSLLMACSDYGDFWGFCFNPRPDVDFKELNGVADITVNKKTKEIDYFIPTMDLDLFLKAKPLPIDQFAEKAAVA